MCFQHLFQSSGLSHFISSLHLSSGNFYGPIPMLTDCFLGSACSAGEPLDDVVIFCKGVLILRPFFWFFISVSPSLLTFSCFFATLALTVFLVIIVSSQCNEYRFTAMPLSRSLVCFLPSKSAYFLPFYIFVTLCQNQGQCTGIRTLELR